MAIPITCHRVSLPRKGLFHHRPDGRRSQHGIRRWRRVRCLRGIYRLAIRCLGIRFLEMPCRKVPIITVIMPHRAWIGARMRKVWLRT